MDGAEFQTTTTGDEFRRTCYRGRRVAAATRHTREALGLASPPGPTEMTGLPPPAPATLSQAEEGSATSSTTGEEEEQRHTAEIKDRIEGGGAVVLFSFSTLFGCLSLLNDDAKHETNVPFSICLLLAFATFFSGTALVLVSMDLRGLREDLVSGGGQHVAAKSLAVSCSVLSVLTLFSLVALLPSGLYQSIGLAAVTGALLPAAGVHWYLRRRTGTGVTNPPEPVPNQTDEAHHGDEHKEELEAVSNITSHITTSAFSGLVGILFNFDASKISGVAAEAVDRAAYVAIFLMFATAVMGMLVMTVSKAVPGIAEPRLLRRFITGIRLANALLLCMLAGAAFAAAFVVVGYRFFAAFAPLVITSIVCFLLRHRVVVRRDGAAGEANNDQREQVKVIEDLASKVTLGGIMSVLAGSFGDKSKSQQPGVVRDLFMVVLTSAFVSGLGIMLLAASPGSARTLLAPPAMVLIWSSVALFAATAVAVYGVEGWIM